MTLQTSGPISISQAMAECSIGGQQDAGAVSLSHLAGVSSGQEYAWSYWYGKSNGQTITQVGTQFFDVNYIGACWANFTRSIFLKDGAGNFQQSGGDTTVCGNMPANTPVNGFIIAGIFRGNNVINVIAENCSLDGCIFTSSLGEAYQLSNDDSWTWEWAPAQTVPFAEKLYTAYAAIPVSVEPATETYSFNISGVAQRPQPGITPVPDPPSGECCFIAGSLVLMANRTWQAIETIQAGDWVMGPTGPAQVVRLHVSPLATNRSLMSFAEDDNMGWSQEHTFWAKQNDKQWWWSGGGDLWRAEVASGLVPGLKDVQSLFEGEVEYAHLTGFVKRTPYAVLDVNPDTLVYLPVTKGSPIIVNGYVVGACLDEASYDYTQLDWDEQVTALASTQANLFP